MPDDISIPQAGPMNARVSFSHSYRTRRTGMDQGTQRLLIAAGALGLMLVGGMSVWALIGRGPATVPVIEADSRPLRVKPDNPGGMQVVGANEDIMGNGGAQGGTGTMAPAPEAPAPQALRAQLLPPTPAPRTTASAPAPSGPSAVGASASAPPVSAPSVSALSVSAPSVSAPSAGSPAAPAPSAPSPAAAPSQAASTQPEPAPRLAVHPASAPSASRSAAGGTLVQLAALETEQAAKTEWQRLSKRMPELLADRKPVMERAEHDGHAIWRVRTGGFADIAEATGFCAKVRAKGGGCSIASF